MSSEKQVILVTGGAGYIGSHTIIDLIDSGYDVISIDNFYNAEPDSFDRIKKITGVDVKNYNIDLQNFEDVQQVFNENNIQSVIHFAAYKAVGESVHEPMKYYRNNLLSIINLLESGAKNFIFSSSCTVYGQPDQFPVDESFPIIPAESPYGNTKQVGEEIITDYSHATPEFRSVLLRYFNPVGAHSSGLNGELPKGVPSNLVPFITQTAYGLRDKITVFGDDYNTNDGSCIRDYIHVMDIAHAHTLAIGRLLNNKNKKNIEVFNLGSGNGVSVLEMIEAFKKSTNQPLNYTIGPRREGDIAKIYSDSTKAKETLGWECKRNLEEIMRSAWEWEKNYRG